MPATLSILIVARDAARTVTRAVRSAVAELDCPVLLIDDGSEDGTADLAEHVGGERLRVIRAAHGGVSAARQQALEAVTTPYAAWLDADDEWVPGRAERMVRALEAGATIVSDALDLHDGMSGRWLRRLTVPGFVRGPGGLVRLFERNFLPGDTQVGFRVAAFRAAGGYDAAIIGPESFDLLLRVVARGATLAAVDEVGYRMYAYPTSLSRDLGRQRRALAQALRKHGYDEVFALYERAGFPARLGAWANVLLATYRDEPHVALEWLERASPEHASAGEVLEPDGPWPYAEGWRRAFHRGTLALLVGDDATAVRELRRAEVRRPTPEGANNLSVALFRTGEQAAARATIALALQRLPDYLDARRNAEGDVREITTQPLRAHPTRHEYAR
jgi:glycosyltransferase involved in cell wall biosynthesis